MFQGSALLPGLASDLTLAALVIHLAENKTLVFYSTTLLGSRLHLTGRHFCNRLIIGWCSWHLPTSGTVTMHLKGEKMKHVCLIFAI